MVTSRRSCLCHACHQAIDHNIFVPVRMVLISNNRKSSQNWLKNKNDLLDMYFQLLEEGNILGVVRSMFSLHLSMILSAIPSVVDLFGFGFSFVGLFVFVLFCLLKLASPIVGKWL